MVVHEIGRHARQLPPSSDPVRVRLTFYHWLRLVRFGQHCPYSNQRPKVLREAGTKVPCLFFDGADERKWSWLILCVWSSFAHRSPGLQNSHRIGKILKVL